MSALELHQLELRYESMRRRSASQERRLLASLAERGQQLPIVVVADEPGRFVVVDGYKRVRAARRLGWDLVEATRWELGELDALLLERLMRTGASTGPIEEAWLLRELRDRFCLPAEELARRFDRTPSWVSRRLGLIEDLPGSIQERVRAGEIGAHAAMKYLLPLARANAGDAVRLAEGAARLSVSSRQMGTLYGGWMAGGRTRELVLSDAALYLRAHEEARRAPAVEPDPTARLCEELAQLAALARRISARRHRGVGGPLPQQGKELARALSTARGELRALFSLFDKEVDDARPESADGDPGAAQAGPG